MERFAGDMAVTILLSYLVILGILAIGCIASYLLRGIGMYTLGKRRGMNYPWLAFIPSIIRSSKDIQTRTMHWCMRLQESSCRCTLPSTFSLSVIARNKKGHPSIQCMGGYFLCGRI